MQRHSRLTRATIPLTVATLWLLSACGSSDTSGTGSATSAAAAASTVIKSHLEALHILDPAHDVDQCNLNGLSNLYDNLIRTTQDKKLVPGLAASWSSPDSTTFKMNLRQGVKFQDGTPFNAAAVAAAITRGQTDATSSLKGDLASISSVETPDDHTVVLHLSKPVSGAMVGVFSGMAGLIPSPKAVTDMGDQYGVTGAVGAGPYKTISFSANQSWSVRAWDGYWDAANRKLAGIDFIDMGQTTDTLVPSQVAAGQLDVGSIKDSQIDLVKGKSNLKYIASPTYQYAEIFLNYGQAPFDNPKVRQALEYAVNRQELADALTGGIDKVAWQPLPATMNGHDPSLDNKYPYSVDKAKQLLAEAGYPNGLKIDVAGIAFDYYQRLAQAVQGQLAKAGITITIQPVAGTAINDVLYNTKKYNAAITAYAGNADPGRTLRAKFGTAGLNNPSHTTTPGVDEALASADATSDVAKQGAAYQKISKLVMDNALSVPLYFNSGVTVYSPNLQNIVYAQTTCSQGNYNSPPSVYTTAG
jgi:peptide/nickel transport system substrate-binding protein